MDNNTQWFFADSNKQQQGPFSFAQIQQFAASSQIQADTLIWHEGMANWTPAGQVSGVFGGTPAAVGSPPPMQAGATNPYASPTSAQPMATAGGTYPIPFVKKCSFPLLLVFYGIGMVLIFLGFGMFVAEASKTSKELDHQLRNERVIETLDDTDGLNYEVQYSSNNDFEDFPMAALGLIAFGYIFIIIGWIIAMIHLYRSWHILQPGGARTTPGKAVGFCFIPLFNIYWMFVAYYGWSQDWNRIRSSHSNLAGMPSASEGLFLALPICLIASIIPFVGILVSLAIIPIGIMVLYKMCSVVNAMAAAGPQR